MPRVAQGKPLCQTYLLCLLMLFMPSVTSKVFELRCFSDDRRVVLLDIDFTLRVTASTTRYGQLLGDHVAKMIKTTEDMRYNGGVCGTTYVQLRLLFGRSYFTVGFQKSTGLETGGNVVTFFPGFEIYTKDLFPWMESGESYIFHGPKGTIPDSKLSYKCLRSERYYYRGDRFSKRRDPFVVQVDMRSIRIKAFDAPLDKFPPAYSCGTPRNHGAVVAASVMFALLIIAIVVILVIFLRRRRNSDERAPLVGSPQSGERDSESA